MEGNIAFKAFLYKDKNDSPSEVRWFYVEQNMIVSFQNVKDKLQDTFPCLNGNNYTLSWKDCDNDLVHISSDAELLIALTNIRSDPRRLYIHLINDQKKSPRHNSTTKSTDSVVHKGVICDVCDGEIYGFRYKCIECPDFDLCSRCEMKNEHREHCFIRITDPAASSRLRKCLSHQLGKKIFKGYCSAFEKNEPKSDGRKHHHKRHHGPSSSSARQGWFEMLSKYLNEVNTAMAEENTTSAAENEPAKSASNVNNEQNTPTASDDVHVNYLRNIGQTIANLLDPLGIDVDIDVRNRTTTTTTNMETENVSESTEKPTENKTTQSEPTATNTNTNTSTNNNATENCNRAVPVFPPGFIPVYTTCTTTPIVSAFINGNIPTETTENGWTIVDETETNTNTSGMNDNNEKKNDTENQPNTNGNADNNKKKNDTENTNDGSNGNGNANNPFMFLPQGLPFPPPPPQQPEFNFDRMARELQKHIQTHFKGAMSTAATVASNVATNIHPMNFPQASSASSETKQNSTTNIPRASSETKQNSTTTTKATGTVPKMYPDLQREENKNTENNEPTAPPQAVHKDERVSRGLEAMLAMGFNNEGGWLTTVLECVHGDVTKALDLLQPVRK